MKAIVVAGGHGSRLYPMTKFTHKTLLPLSGRPIIDYVLSTIRRSGIKDITIIGNKFIDKIREHVGDDVNYVLEIEPKGVAKALQLARDGNEGTPFDLVLRQYHKYRSKSRCKGVLWRCNITY